MNISDVYLRARTQISLSSTLIGYVRWTKQRHNFWGKNKQDEARVFILWIKIGKYWLFRANQTNLKMHSVQQWKTYWTVSKLQFRFSQFQVQRMLLTCDRAYASIHYIYLFHVYDSDMIVTSYNPCHLLYNTGGSAYILRCLVILKDPHIFYDVPLYLRMLLHANISAIDYYLIEESHTGIQIKY